MVQDPLKTFDISRKQDNRKNQDKSNPPTCQSCFASAFDAEAPMGEIEMLRVNGSKNWPFAEEGESSTLKLLRSLSGMFMDKGGEFYIIYSSEGYIQFSH